MFNLRDDEKFFGGTGFIDARKLTGVVAANPKALAMGNIQFNPNNQTWPADRVNLPFVPSQIFPGGLPNSGLPSTNPGQIFGPIIGPNLIMTPELQKQMADLYEKQNPPVPEVKKHSHYHKDVSKLKTIDVYRVLELFNVTDQALGHAIKKLLVAGGRGAGKSIEKDIQEAVDTLNRRLEMAKELASV